MLKDFSGLLFHDQGALLAYQKHALGLQVRQALRQLLYVLVKDRLVW